MRLVRRGLVGHQPQADFEFRPVRARPREQVPARERLPECRRGLSQVRRLAQVRVG